MKPNRALYFIVGMIITLNLFSLRALAGENLGYVTYTNVVSYINHFPIPSYNYRGYTLIAVEDLQTYGFNVKWNEYKKSLCIFRNDQNRITPQLTFKSTQNNLGHNDFMLTSTSVKTYIGDYQWEIESFGGLTGKTLVNIDNLTAFGKVEWVPEVNAVKVWIEDGLEMLSYPWNVREFDYSLKYYKYSCLDTDRNHWSMKGYPNVFILTFAKLNEKNGMLAACESGYIEITDVIDSEGVSRKKSNSLNYVKREYFSNFDFSCYPYFYEISDYYLTVGIFLNKADLKPPTKPNGKGLIKFIYHCECGKDDIVDEIRTDELPY